MSLRRIMIALTSCFLLSTSAFAMQPPAAQSEYVPLKDLPPTDQVPAAPFLIAAYGFVWIAAMFYLWTIWRRLNTVETEMRALAEKTSRR
jgi:CcmD family protein